MVTLIYRMEKETWPGLSDRDYCLWGVYGVSDAPSVCATLPTPREVLERNRRAGFPQARDPLRSQRVPGPAGPGGARLELRVEQSSRTEPRSLGAAIAGPVLTRA